MSYTQRKRRAGFHGWLLSSVAIAPRCCELGYDTVQIERLIDAGAVRQADARE